MKKRVLSMLLLVAMVMTAVPLFAFTALAEDASAGEAEKPSFSAEDYNALYVQDGLVDAYDFFILNKYWAGTPEADAALRSPTAPGLDSTWNGKRTTLNNQFVIVRYNRGDGQYDKVYNGTADGTYQWVDVSKVDAAYVYTTKEAAKAVLDTLEKTQTDIYVYDVVLSPVNNSLTTAYSNAVATYKTEALKAIHSYARNGKVTMSADMATYGTVFYNDWDGTFQRLPGYLVEGKDSEVGGYLQMDKDFSSTPYFTLGGIPVGGHLTAEYVMTSGDNNPVNANNKTGEIKAFLSFSDVLFNKVNGKITAFGSYPTTAPRLTYTEGATLPSHAALDIGYTHDPVNTYGIYVDRSAGTTGEISVSVGLWINGEEIATVPATDGNAANGATFLGHENVAESRIYAMRYYQRGVEGVDGTGLTPDEYALNHAADLAKFFRLDISAYRTLDKGDRLAVAQQLKGLDFTDDRETVADAFEAAAYNKAVEKLESEDDAARNAFIAVAKTVRADIDTVAKVVSSGRNMTSVYEGIAENNAATAYTTAAEFEADVEALYQKAYYYDAYRGADDDLDAFIEKAADKQLAIEDFMSLPFAAKKKFAADNKQALDGVTQELLDAFVKAELAKLAGFLPAQYDYDTVYVQDGLYDAIDFFVLNKYWAGTPEAAAALRSPMAPGLDPQWNDENPRMKVNNEFIIVRYVSVDGSGDKVWSESTGAWTSVTSADATIYATRADAEAVLAGLKEDTATYTYTVMTNPVADGQGYTDAYKAAVEAYNTAAPAAINSYWKNQKVSLSSTVVKYWADDLYGAAHFNDWDGTLQRQAGYLVEAKDGEVGGYLQIERYFSVSPYFTVGGIPTKGHLTAEYVMTSGEGNPTGTHNRFLSFSDVYLTKNNGTVSAFYAADKNMAYQSTAFTGASLNVGSTNAVANTYAILVDRTADDGSLTVDLFINGGVQASAKATDAKPTSNSTLLGYDDGSDHRIYAMRYYDRALTLAEMQQNHFADLAKWFRLDIASYAYLTPQQKAELHARFADATITRSTKEALQKTFNEAIGEIYYDSLDLVVSTDAGVNARFFALAKKLNLDVSAFIGVDPAVFGPIALDIVTTFDPAYAQNLAVVSAYIAPTADIYRSMTFAGYQVALDTGAAVANRAGIRAVFDLDTGLLAKLAAGGKAVSVTAELYSGELISSVKYTYDAAEGALVFAAGEELALYDRTTADGRTVTSFNYAILLDRMSYEKDEMTKEYAFKYFIEIDGKKYNVSAASRFDTTVSFAEVYGHFATLDAYAGDRVVKAVLDAANAD